MNAPMLPGIEESFNQLSNMANDPEIQQEIQSIESEFAITDSDGLEILL